jgi:16S rRNA U516 pseudouridylate synthase RsuA-like enzyme
MTAQVGHPTLRLIRQRIEAIETGGMQPGDITELSKKIVYKKLFGE